MDHPHTIGAPYNLASSPFRLDQRRADQEMRRALSDALQVSGENHPIVLVARGLKARQFILEAILSPIVTCSFARIIFQLQVYPENRERLLPHATLGT